MKITEKDVQLASENYFRDCGCIVQPNYKLASGNVDIYLTDTTGKKIIIEIKEEFQIKRAIGQVQSYCLELYADEVHIILFSYCYPKKSTRGHLDHYEKVCDDLGIRMIHVESTSIIKYILEKNNANRKKP